MSGPFSTRSRSLVMATSIIALSKSPCGIAGRISFCETLQAGTPKSCSRRRSNSFCLPLITSTPSARLCIQASRRHVLRAAHDRGTVANLCSTDIKADNILHEIVDSGLLDAFTKEELETPSRRKVVNGATIYGSRKFGLPKRFGGVVLSDFGCAVQGDTRRNYDCQPNVYRSPEVMLKMDWSYPIDIWNVGAMVRGNLQLLTFHIILSFLATNLARLTG